MLEQHCAQVFRDEGRVIFASVINHEYSLGMLLGSNYYFGYGSLLVERGNAHDDLHHEPTIIYSNQVIRLASHLSKAFLKDPTQV